MKLKNLTLCLCLITTYSFSQSKKEQIETMQLSLDSCKTVIESLQNEATRRIYEINQFKSTLSKAEEDKKLTDKKLSEAQTELIVLKKENKHALKKLDSISKLNVVHLDLGGLERAFYLEESTIKCEAKQINDYTISLTFKGDSGPQCACTDKTTYILKQNGDKIEIASIFDSESNITDRDEILELTESLKFVFHNTLGRLDYFEIINENSGMCCELNEGKYSL